MKNLYKTFKNKLKNCPHLSLKYLTFKCPAFIVNTLMRNPHTQLFETRHWWDNYPETDSVKYYSNTLQYQP